MSAHTGYANADAAAQGPTARWLRSRGPQGSLVTVYSDDACAALGYRTANRNQVFIQALHELREWGVIEFQAEKGRGAAITVRVLR